ncbi:MAG: DUF4411 family protein [Chloroflexota bacterium]
MTDPQSRSLLARYSLDTSFFIDLWSIDVGEFPRDVFKGVWQALESAITEGEIVAPEAVREELLDTTSGEQKAWVRSNGTMFVPLDMGQIEATQEIVRTYPKYAEEPKNLADPAVVALAKCDGLTVLTSEKRAPTHSPNKPKIPNVSDEFGVKWLSIVGWCRAEGIEVVRS